MLSYLRSVLLTIPLSFLTTAVLIWISYFLSLFHRSAIDPMFRFWARAVMWVCGARHRAYGVERVDSSRNYVVVSNHLSLIDSPLLVAYLPLSVRFLAKKELFKIPVMGGYMARTGHIPIDRSNPRAALTSMAEAARILGQGRRSVLIYPEGTRSMTGEMQDFKDGAALLAIKAGLPILPAAVLGTNNVLPSKGVVIRSARVELRIGEPVETKGLGVKDRERLTREIEERVRRLQQRTVEE
jgi:1-acyl-sn-glycerol-3-phosphate acyltransferase